MRHLHLRILTATLPFLLSMPYGVAQPVQPPTRAEAQAALNPPPAPAQFTKAQLDQMLAPIALYPDQLLTQLLMAATFPDQLVDAAKWLQDSQNAALKGDDMANALQPLPWDPSVKSLVAFPQIIVMLTDHLDWTEALGTAFANQEVEVFSRVQFLRERAKQAGKLQSTSQIAVREQDSDIIIESADPNMIYVPVYNPAEVYGDWPDRNAPPVYIPPPPGLYGGAVGAGIAFSAGLGVVAPLWGWGHTDWHRHAVVIDPGRYQRITSETVTRQNRVTVEHDTWRRSGPVAFVPEGRRPAPPQPTGQQPAGTIRPSEFAHREFGPSGRPGGAPPPGQSRPTEAQPGPRPEQRPAQAQPGPGPGGEPARGEQRGEPGHPPPPQNEVHPPPQGQPGPHSGEQHGEPGHPPSPPQTQPGPHPGEQHGEPGHAPPPSQGQSGPHPGEQHGEPGHPPPPQNEAHPPAQPGPHPGGQPGEGPHPEHHAEPPHPPGGQQGEQHPPQPPGPPPQQQHAPPPPQAQPPQQQHAAPPPQAQPPQQPHPAPPQGPPPQAHPQGPPPQAAHPPGPGPQQPHPGGQPPGDKKGDEDKH